MPDDREYRVTRFEVIDDNGRVLTANPCKIRLSYQDDGRTLKVFVTGKARGRVSIAPEPEGDK